MMKVICWMVILPETVRMMMRVVVLRVWNEKRVWWLEDGVSGGGGIGATPPAPDIVVWGLEIELEMGLMIGK